jgi:hypothetical protein
VPRERQRRISANYWATLGAGPLDKPLLERGFAFRQAVRTAECSQTEFREVAEEIAGIEGRISEAKKVEIEQIQPRTGDDHLIGVKITMNNRD